jgi:aminoglycoside phosphotransferase (APT) family kinase protein
MALGPGTTELAAADLAHRVVAVLHGRWRGVSVGAIEQLQGGASGLTYRARLAGAPVTEIVFKVAPPGFPPVRNRDVLRQARLLAALGAASGVRVPAVYACDPGDPPECPPLFVMSFEPGTSEEPLHVEADVAADEVHARGLHAARMLAALHRFDVSQLANCGLPAEPVLTAQQEVERWIRAFATVPAELRSGAEDTAAMLLTTVPEARLPAVCHGDWRLGNTLCVGGEIKAVIDWEIWSVGDARADLAWFLMMCDPAHPAAIAGQEAGLPAVAELVHAYATEADGPVPALPWFRALAAFKQAAVTALLAKHAAQRDSPLEQVTARLATLLPEMQAWAQRFLTQTK